MNISTLPDLRSLFPFQLDEFQEEAIASLNAGESVVVCAPTGSGKTLIGEYAIHKALASGKRVFYTTPLKALSNQKLRDFRNEFGADRVGLLTGDTSVNRDAPILVMTTEIFRNMLYGTPIGQVGTSVIDVDAVVLDECHYMNDRQRGTVWEESIIYAPPGIQLVALSATIANSDQLTDWIDKVHGPTKLIYSDFRPVPLQFHFCNPKGLFPLLNDNNKAINPRLKPKGGKPKGRQEAPGIEFLLSQLQQRDMLPAIYFIFSRRGCDRAVENLSHLTLVNPREAASLKEQIDAFVERSPEAVRTGHLESLYRGIASHHAGVLPAWKGLIEELFQQGLIKVVFATETLAAGINMPARTTVISSLSKRTDHGHRLLNASEFLQMAGRAGRRGMDLQGHVVTVQTPYEGASEAAYLATSKADPLVSQFSPSYGMVLNLLQTHSIEEAQDLVERSFGHYLSTLHLKPQQQAINDLIGEIEHQKAQIKDINTDLVANYEKLSERLREERRLLKTLQHQAMEMQADQVAMAVAFAVSGTLLTIKTKQMAVPMPATLVMKLPGSGQFPYLVCLGQDNRWYVAAVADVVGLHAEYPRLAQVDRLAPPEDLSPRVGSVKKGDDSTLAIVRMMPPINAEQDIAPEVQQQQARVKAIEEQIQTHPLRQLGDPGNLIKRQKRIWDLEEQLRDRQSKFQQYSQRYWQEFLSLMEVLGHFGCLENNKPTPLGQVAAAIRGDNELWLGLALASGELDALEPQHLAAVSAALVTEVSRPDNWTRYEPSGEIEEALGELWSVRRELLKLQRRYKIAFPAWLESDWIGLIEQWALGIEWQELCSHTNLDEGDVVRILRRTVDFLSQVPHVPFIADELKQNARRAIQLIDRFPVNESAD